MRLSVEQQSVAKVCQLTGEWDRQRNTPAFNQTQSRFNLFGTDLGSSFEHDGRLWFLFGDTWPTPFNPTAGIAAVSRAPQHLEVFAVAEDGMVRGRWFWDGWKDWYRLDGARFSQTAGIAAVSRSPEHIELFAVGEDGMVRGRWFWDEWKGWYVLDGAHFSQMARVAAVSRSPQHMEVFAVGKDGLIRGRRFLDGWDAGWYVLEGAAFSHFAGIAAVSRTPDHMEVFALGEDGVLRGNWWWAGSWQGWYVLGGFAFNQTAAIAAVSRAPEHMEVFAVGTDGVIRGRWFWNDWKGWYLLDGAGFPQHGAIAATSRDPRHMEVFAITKERKVTGRAFWDEWAPKWLPLETCSDSVAWTDATEVGQGFGLHFVSDGDQYRSPRIFEAGQPVGTGCLEVPLSGFSWGGQMYVFHSTDFGEVVRPDGTRVDLMGRSVLCRAVNNDPTDLDVIYTMSDVRLGGRFVNVSCRVEPAGLPGLPFSGPALIAWGSGEYRFSDVYMGAVPLSRLGERSAWQFYRGGSQPWSIHEHEAQPMLGLTDPMVGELCGAWVPALNSWLLLQNSETAAGRGIWAYAAAQPWGPWSEGTLLFNPDWPGLGYGAFMHHVQKNDLLSDPGRDDEYGGEYGPYLIDRFTAPLPDGPDGSRRARLHFLLSTWNPYNVMLLRADVSVA